MTYRTPYLEIYPERIKQNAENIIGLCASHEIDVAAVTKVTAAHFAVAQALNDAEPTMIADSRVSNLRAIGEYGINLPRLCLRLPAPSNALEVVRDSEYSLNSGLPTLKALSEAALSQSLVHKVIIMVDVGDLREGVWPTHAVDLVKEAAKLKGIHVVGMGCNLACYGGVIPSIENMQTLIQVRDECRKATGLPLDLLSGGNSANLPLLLEGDMPDEINHLRIGETIMLGRNVIDRSPFPGTRQDTFRLFAEVIEVESKPSIPIGNRGQDAFGGSTDFVDRGVRKRAICVIGRQDVVVDGIMPEDKGITVLGGSSDHLILDVEEAKTDVRVGDELSFFPNYGALLALSTSPYVAKIVVKG